MWGYVTRRGYGVPHVWWHVWAPWQAMLWGVVIRRGRRSLHISSTNDILFTNDAVDPEVTNPPAELFDHRLAHQAHPPQTFADLTLSRPIQFTFVVLDIGFVLFIR